MSHDFDFNEIGMETRDKRVYEALVAQPKASLRQIAAATGINRGSVYESIKQLAAAGLVGAVESSKQRRYAATDPSIIIELLRERQARAVAAESRAADYITRIAAETAEEAAAPPFATHYEDDEGVAAILRDVISTCRTQGVDYRVISTSSVRQYMYHNFRNFTQRRIAEGITVRVIAVGKGGTSDELSERRWLEAKRGRGPNCYTIIYGNKTAFISMNDANALSGIVIDNAGVAHLQKELFDRLWHTL
jgi:sugar-specific transcriptional regulator TrmB